MGAKRVINGVHVVPMGMANAFLIEGDDGLTLIDAGFPAKEAAVFGAIDGIGRSADHLRHLVFTHGHPDHIGSAAAIVRKAGARTYMHPLDIPTAESGGPFRPMRPAPGLLGQVLCRLFFDPDERGTRRTAVASGTHAVRGRCVHEPHGPRRSRRLREFGAGACEPAQTCQSFIRCCRVRPRQAYRPRCVGAVPL
jgi:glyoxylase-like metal-dependent hydrolase (beta-lactamase superfamily II)